MMNGLPDSSKAKLNIILKNTLTSTMSLAFDESGRPFIILRE
jgi:hypothetical protein